jgi:drug/metabolite transporter (DMT)-like permease
VTQTNTRLGIILMLSATLIFAIQDGISRHLASEYNVFMVVMVRYWFFAAFVLCIAKVRAGSIRKAAFTTQPLFQIFRSLLLVTEICIAVLSFVYVGLIQSMAIFSANPLIVAALSGPILGEKVGMRRWIAICVGFVGILIILQPGAQTVDVTLALPIGSAILFALYAVFTRLGARKDSAQTSFFWTGIVGCVFMTAIGVFHWQEMSVTDSMWMLCLCITGVLGHFLLIKSYEVAEASGLQPFTYFHLVFVSILAMTVFGETIEKTTAIGAAVVVAAGLYTIWRERRVNRATDR